VTAKNIIHEPPAVSGQRNVSLSLKLSPRNRGTNHRQNQSDSTRTPVYIF
jgi:hypothetical protein